MPQLTAGATFTNGSNNYIVLDVIPADYPFKQVLKEYHEGGIIVIQNSKTTRIGYADYSKIQQRIDEGTYTMIEE